MNVNNLALFGNFAAVRRPRTYRIRASPIIENYSDEEIRDQFRFRRDSIEFIRGLVNDELSRDTNRNHALSVENQVLIGLRFLASGSFQQVIGDTIGVHKLTVSRTVDRFCTAIINRRREFVKFPMTENEKNHIKEGFFKLGGFPSVCGCIDCTHVRIIGPHLHENDYVNRKGFHSINVQGITDHEGKFIDLLARWPGSTHDSFIFRTSPVKYHLERNHDTLEKGVLLGDSGYCLKHYLITPFENPATPQQRRFNRAQKTTRCSVERAFGVFKRRFHCLHSGLRVDPAKACKIIGACAVLHNIAILRNEQPFDDDILDEEFECEPYHGDEPESGLTIRNHIANTFFR